MTCPGHNPITHHNSKNKRRIKKNKTNLHINKKSDTCEKMCLTLWGKYKLCLASQEEIHKIVFF